jgi:cytochrome c peroxidase
VLNAALQFKAHWIGEFENVEAQARQALTGPGFGNPSHEVAMSRIKAIPGYTDLFDRAFPDQAEPVIEENWGKAIGAYERTLLTPSRFDEFLGGKLEALSAAEQRGLRKFIGIGCAECHHGVALGGQTFRKFGVVDNFWKLTGSKEIDKGRFIVTKADKDTYVFKVSGLRNVAMTPPYFHDGSIKTLPQAVQIMASVQLGTELSEEENQDIVAFLESLTGSLPASFATAPILPPSGHTP